jgi:hypothetical protein
MKSMTIHGLNPDLDAKIRKRAIREGKSLNKTIKELLAESLGIRQGNLSGHRDEFMDLFGVWNQADKEEMDALLRDFDIVDQEDWS